MTVAGLHLDAFFGHVLHFCARFVFERVESGNFNGRSHGFTRDTESEIP